MIKANKTLTIDIPSVSRNLPERSLVRTGTYGDGNCFFHALLRAIDTSYRRQSSYHLHLKLVERFRSDIVEWLTPELFQELGKGEPMRLGFLTELNNLIDETIEDIDEHPSPTIRILYKIVTKQEIDDSILPQSLKDENFYVSFCKQVEKIIREKLRTVPKNKVDSLCSQAHDHFVHLFKQAHHQSIESFKSKLLKMGEYADSTQMECISRYTGYNFIFIHHEKDNEMYNGNFEIVSFDTNLKCLIFLWINENHFEIVGELEDQNMINRIFDAKDPLIQSLMSPKSRSPVRPYQNHEFLE
jgi:hypothetical protein